MEFAKIPFSFSLLFRCMWRSEILPWGRYAPTLNPHLSWNPISSELEISGLQKASAPHFLERIDHQVLLKAPTYSRREPVLFSCCTYHVLSLDGVKIAPLLDQLNKTVSPYISSIQLERGFWSKFSSTTQIWCFQAVLTSNLIRFWLPTTRATELERLCQGSWMKVQSSSSIFLLKQSNPYRTALMFCVSCKLASLLGSILCSACHTWPWTFLHFSF